MGPRGGKSGSVHGIVLGVDPSGSHGLGLSISIVAESFALEKRDAA